MSDNKYELTGLSNIYRKAIEKDERTISFEIRNGKGEFLILMFFDPNDQDSKDLIYIFMRNTQRMVKLKLYGNHLNGDFTLYLKSYVKTWFKNELQLDSSNYSNPFNFRRFFQKFNQSIPTSIPFSQKIKTLRNSWSEVKNNLPRNLVDENDKIILIGVKRLPEGHHPREQTLRKLYLYADGTHEDIKALINNLKQMNMTTCWTDDKNKLERAKKVTDLL